PVPFTLELPLPPPGPCPSALLDAPGSPPFLGAWPCVVCPPCVVLLDVLGARFLAAWPCGVCPAFATVLRTSTTSRYAYAFIRCSSFLRSLATPGTPYAAAAQQRATSAGQSASHRRPLSRMGAGLGCRCPLRSQPGQDQCTPREPSSASAAYVGRRRETCLRCSACVPAA